MADKILLVGGERVSILKAYTHTYVVMFLKRGTSLEVHKSKVISWTPNKKSGKKSISKKKKTDNPQTKLDL